ncbi:MAG: hypothetical protein ACI4MJ_12380 [Aristaeellaceae bacterium]
MESLWVVIVIVWAIAQAVGSSKKKQAKQAQQMKKQRQLMDEIFKQDDVQPIPAAQMAAPPAPAAPPAAMMPSQPVDMMPPLPQTRREPLAPRVHTHTAPACPEDDNAGSMPYHSPEGVDPCHVEQLPPMTQPRPDTMQAPAEQPGIRLDWTGENMVKAFVMQEVLTRPCQRRMNR